MSTDHETVEPVTATFPTADALQGIVDLAVPVELDDLSRTPSKVAATPYLVPTTHRMVLVATEQFHDVPDRATGTVHVRDLRSFVDYFGKHASPTAEIHADHERHLITGILNAPAGGEPSFRDLRVVLDLKLSKALQRWIAIDGKQLDQDAFAEFVEDNALDIVEPSSSTMLDISTTLIAKKGLDFEQSVSLHNGQRVFQYKETIGATAGARGELTIPQAISLALVPFEGGDAFKVDARFRFRILQSGLKFIVKLDNLDRVLESAFDGLVDNIAQGLTEHQLIVQGPAPEARTPVKSFPVSLQ